MVRDSETPETPETPETSETPETPETPGLPESWTPKLSDFLNPCEVNGCVFVELPIFFQMKYLTNMNGKVEILET